MALRFLLASIPASPFTGSMSSEVDFDGGGINFVASEFAAFVLFNFAALILALTLAASASRSVAASLAAIDAIVRGLC